MLLTPSHSVPILRPCSKAAHHCKTNLVTTGFLRPMGPSTASKAACPSSPAAAHNAVTSAQQQPQQQQQQQQQQQPLRYALAIHGGAGVINTSNSVWISSAMEGLQAALEAGDAVLRAGGSAVDAAVASVVVMENDPHFNAGVGSVLAASGQHELEASIMSSSGSACGAVALIKQVANPIVLAKHVMEHTPHIFLSGPEAEQLAVQQGMQLVDNATFTTQQRKEQWERYAAEQRLAPADEIVQRIGPAGAAAAPAEGSKPAAAAADNSRDHCQTVGAVAIDSQGRLAAATSTGGRTNKWDGRIGDTPMIGAGTWADASCAVSGTGVGEEFIRRAAAHDVAARMEYKGISLSEAMHEVVWQSMSKGDGGFVGVDKDYNCVMDFNSVGMYRAAVDYRGNHILAVFSDEEQQQEKQEKQEELQQRQ